MKTQNTKSKNTKSKNTKSNTPDSHFQVWGVSPDLKKEFKTACIKTDVTMKEVIIAYMKKYSRMNS